MSALKTWFDGRSLREKRLLLVMAALMVVTILWAGIVRPVDDGLASARERHSAAVVRLGETQAQVEALTGIRRPPPLTGSLADTVRAAADEAGFALQSLNEGGPGRVRAQIQSARAAALIPWLNRLERGGILVEQATLTDNGDRTVGVTLVLRSRAA